MPLIVTVLLQNPQIKLPVVRIIFMITTFYYVVQDSSTSNFKFQEEINGKSCRVAYSLIFVLSSMTAAISFLYESWIGQFFYFEIDVSVTIAPLLSALRNNLTIFFFPDCALPSELAGDEEFFLFLMAFWNPFIFEFSSLT